MTYKRISVVPWDRHAADCRPHCSFYLMDTDYENDVHV